MANNAKIILITYDIVDDNDRNKVSGILLNAGAVRVQKSVFECLITEKEFEGLRKKLKPYRKKQDSIRYYHLCNRCFGKTIRDEHIPEMGICNIENIISV